MTSGHLQRRLGLVSAVSITVGAVIGSGIFLTPREVAFSLPDVGWIYLLWLGLGAVCLFGAFAYAELGAMFPEAGGQYAFLREGWGRGVAFLYGWTFFWVINSGTIAALAHAFADTLLPLLGWSTEGDANLGLRVALAAAMIVLLAIANHFGVVIGAIVQNLSTFAKLGALALICLGGVLVSGGSELPATAALQGAGAATSLTVSGLVAAFIAIFWTYEGWYQLPFNAAELKRPGRDLPLGLIVGMLILIVTYLLVNAVYLHVVPFAEMRTLEKDVAIPELTIARVFSPDMVRYLSLLIAISVMGAANPNLLSSPRAFYAMAQDGMVPQALLRVHPRWGTPTVSIWVQAVWALLLIAVPACMPADSPLHGFHDVTAFVVFAGFLFYGLTVAAVYRLRRLRPDLPRPYRCTGYPVTPALFVVVSVAFVVALLLDAGKRQNALVGLGLIATALPFYFALRWRGRRRS